MYVNGMGFRAIERVKGVPQTVIYWVKQLAKQLPDAPQESEIQRWESWMNSKHLWDLKKQDGFGQR